MQESPKRRGCPPGGWPSQVKAKAKAALAQSIAALPTALPSEPLSYAFTIEHEGKALWAVVMLTLQGSQVIERTKISSGDFGTNALVRLGNACGQLFLNQRKPESIKNARTEIVATVGG